MNISPEAAAGFRAIAAACERRHQWAARREIVAACVRVFLRGFVLVALVAANTRQIASGRYVGAFLIGGLISFVWWENSSAKREQFKGAGAVYALGAAVGTVVGMWVGR